MTGETLGPFRILGPLGEGGMGAVYRAEDTRLGRQVAIKVLPEAFTADPERLARFEREAQVVAGLNHPNICVLHDVGHAAPASDPTRPVHYLVMELVDGETLRDRIARGLEPDEAIRIAVGIAEALEAAHAKGIVHRDLKPTNVMLTADGAVKVLDFGLAKAWVGAAGASDPSLSRSPTRTHGMTQAGTILGTAGYMSPEQTRGLEADPRSDVWAWGVLLHEMLTGTPLFEGPTLSDTLAAVLRAEIDWTALPATTPRRVRTVLRRCLERDPRNRLHAIADARIELAGPGSDEPEAAAATPAARTGRTTAGIVAAAIALGLLVGAAGWWMRPDAAPLPLRVARVAGGLPLSGASVSPDGTRVVLVRQGRLFVRSLDATVERELPDVEDAVGSWGLAWSPDGRRIAYATSDEIFTVPADGGPPQRACAIPDATRSEGIVLGLAWSRPDTLVFGLDARGLWQVPALGGEPEILLVPDRETRNEAALHFPVLLPDGVTLAARVRWRDRPNDTFTFLRDGARTDVRFPDWSLDRGIVTADGYLAFIRQSRDEGVWAVPFSIENLRTEGDPVRVLPGAFQELSIAGDGTLVALASPEGGTQTVVVDRAGTVVRTLAGLGAERDPAVSPDGTRVAVWGIQVHDGQRTLTVTPTRGSGPAWTPDGREIVYDGREGLMRVPADGSRDPVVVLDTPIETPHVSPDGRHVAYSVVTEDDDASERDVLLGRDRRSDIFVLDLAGPAEPRPFRDAPASELYPRFSPDGRFLAYASDASGRFEIYVTTFPAGDRRWQVSVDGGRFPRWSPAGDEIYFVEGGNLMAAPFRARPEVDLGAPRRLLSTRELPYWFSGFGQACYDVTPDGDFVVVQRELELATGATLVQNWAELYRRGR